VFGADVAPDGVVEERVVALADDGNDHVFVAADARMLLRHPFDRRVGDFAHRQRVGQKDRRLDQSPLRDLRQARQLARAVEHEGAADEPLAIDILVRQDAGDAGAHRALAFFELALATYERGVSDLDAADVGDGIERTSRIAPDGDADFA
jgi:hypothetical protein